jgi:hypothetical protein
MFGDEKARRRSAWSERHGRAAAAAVLGLTDRQTSRFTQRKIAITPATRCAGLQTPLPHATPTTPGPRAPNVAEEWEAKSEADWDVLADGLLMGLAVRGRSTASSVACPSVVQPVELEQRWLAVDSWKHGLPLHSWQRELQETEDLVRHWEDRFHRAQERAKGAEKECSRLRGRCAVLEEVTTRQARALARASTSAQHLQPPRGVWVKQPPLRPFRAIGLLQERELRNMARRLEDARESGVSCNSSLHISRLLGGVQRVLQSWQASPSCRASSQSQSDGSMKQLRARSRRDVCM